MAVKLNSKQKEIFEQLKSFAKEDTYDTFILNGYAGTGKTFLVQEFAKYLQSKKKRFELLASTGRAAAVLRGKTDFSTSTVHGALYSFSKVDGDSDEIPDDAPIDEFGQMTLVFEAKKSLDTDCIYIVDEASMLASELTEGDSFANFGTGMLLPDLLDAIGKSKIIFVGDPAQLPPVFQANSPALDKDWLNDFGRKTQVGTLDEIMRTQADNDILEIAQSIRKQIGVQASSMWIKFKARNKNNCFILPDKNTVFLEYYARFLQYGPKDSIAIAPSNRLCNHLNEFVRRRLYPQARGILEIGEVLMVTQNNYLVPLTNGDFIKVEKLGNTTSKVGLDFQYIVVRHLDTDKTYNILISLEPFKSISSNLNIDQQRNLMIDFSKRMRRKGIRPNSDTYQDSMRKDPYLNSLRASYGYVVTCHKAQGGEWKDVFLFLDKSMYGYMKADAMRQWWYTAITRAKENIYLHDDFWIE